jgi:hypothetical protein
VLDFYALAHINFLNYLRSFLINYFQQINVELILLAGSVVEWEWPNGKFDFLFCLNALLSTTESRQRLEHPTALMLGQVGPHSTVYS